MSAARADGTFAGRRAIVTGGSRGIGAAVVRHLAALARRATCSTSVAGGERRTEHWSALDVNVRDERAVEAAFARAAAELDGLDVVIAAAGIVPVWSATDNLDLREWDEVFAVNARGVAATIKHAARRIADGGSIVAVASLNAYRVPNIASYVASKHAVLGIVRSAALDLGGRGIRVNAVAPGPIADRGAACAMQRRERDGGLAVNAALQRAPS